MPGGRVCNAPNDPHEDDKSTFSRKDYISSFIEKKYILYMFRWLHALCIQSTRLKKVSEA
jgi:hypothetical protein